VVCSIAWDGCLDVTNNSLSSILQGTDNED
jgi:hypothetical protein